MARARRLKSGAPAHEFTGEERSRGGRVRAARIAEERAEQQRLAADRARELVHRALDKVEDALDGGDARLALTAARDILDRTLGKQLVATGTGEPITVKLDLGVGAEPWARWASDEELEAVEEIVVRAEGRRDRDEKPPAGKSKPRRAAGKRAPRKRPATSPESKPAAEAKPAAKPKRARRAKRDGELLSPAVRAAVEKQEAAKKGRQTEPSPPASASDEAEPKRRRGAAAITSSVMEKQF